MLGETDCHSQHIFTQFKTIKMKKLILLTAFSFFAISAIAQSYPEMITVEGGTFTMGDTEMDGNDDEQPTHQVTLKTFKIAKTETTVAQWRAYCSATGRAMPETMYTLLKCLATIRRLPAREA